MFNIREYQQQQRAVQAIESGQPVEMNGNFTKNTDSSQTVIEIALKNEINKIRSFSTLAERAEYKRNSFLPKWLPFCDDYFAQNEHYQNDVIGYCLIYLFDIDEIEKALSLAEKAIANGQAMPEGFNRTISAVVADSVYSWAEKEHGAGRAIEPYFSQTLGKLCKESWKVHEFVLAKWFKFTARLLLSTNGKTHPASINEPERLLIARALCAIAFDLNSKVGVISLIERITMRINALEEYGISFNFEPLQRGEPTASLSKIEFSRIAELLASPPLSLEEVLKKTEQCSTAEKVKPA